MRKFLPYILILMILAGVLGPAGNAQAQTVTGCYNTRTKLIIGNPPINKDACQRLINSSPGPKNPDGTPQNPIAYWVEVAGTTPPTDPCSTVGTGKPGDPAYDKCVADLVSVGERPPTPGNTTPGDNEFERQFNMNAVAPCMEGTFSINISGCLVRIFYYLFYSLASFVLALAAYFFNALISISLGSTLMSGSEFIKTGWAVVRDLSNIFFILILLYIAIKLILGLGGHDTKKMIAKVIILALLINFSMFFTKIVIDSSNILALVFYNKLDVTTKNPDGSQRPSTLKTKDGLTKDLAGSMFNSFNPASKLTWDNFFNEAKQIRDVNGKPTGKYENFIPAGPILGIILTSGAVMLFAAYAFFVAGIAFVARLIELFILVIFSPFAFMSSALPLLGHIEYIGWDAWFKRLLKVSFMAPIFMFFMYFIFLLLNAKLFDNLITSEGMIETLLYFTIPAMMILILLLKATEFAKKGSGVIGEKLLAGAKMVGGLAMGAAGGVALGRAGFAARTAIGGGGGFLAGKAAEYANKGGATKFGSAIGLNKLASGLTSVEKLAKTSSFDVRGTAMGKAFSSATGIKMGEAQKGGYEQARKDKVEKRMKRAKMLEVGEDEGLKQALNKTEGDLQELLGENAKIIETLDKDIEKKRQEVADANNKLSAARGTPAEDAARTVLTEANRKLDMAKENKTDFRKGREYMMTNSAGIDTLNAGTGVDINAMEELKKDQAQAIKTENVRRKQKFANRIERVGWLTAREAASEIRKDTQLTSGTKT